jgi:hypothetical protein
MKGIATSYPAKAKEVSNKRGQTVVTQHTIELLSSLRQFRGECAM